jgi:hypothetical protein
MAAEQISLVSFTLADYPIAILASQSKGLAAPSPETLAKARAHRAWLLKLLQAEQPSPAASDQILLLQGPGGTFPLEIDSLPVLETASIEDLRPLPSLMAQVSALTALRGFWLRNGQLRFLFDFHQLPAFAP